jgi:uncharacterized protein YraI
MTIYVMKRIWFKFLLGMVGITTLGVGAFLSTGQAQAYQVVSYQTGVFITVTYSDPINVRGGPNTIDYPIVGQLLPGDTAPALGVSPGHEWVQIAYPGTATGTGWVYATYVSVSGGDLPAVEPPPTSTPPVTPTIDLTLVAAFNSQPTQVRLPTFTPPPPLTVPAFTDDGGTPGSSSVFGIFIIGLGLIGGIGLLVSFILRK